MMRKRMIMKGSFLLGFMLLTSWGVYGGGISPGKKDLVAGCQPPSAYADLNVNNVRARIYTSGLFWFDERNNSATYFVPANDTKVPLYSGGLWVGGRDQNGNARVTVANYTQRNYFTGPLSTDGNQSTSAQNCSDYDRIWVLYRQDVKDFVNAFNNDPTLNGYTIPQCIIDYPAHGDPAQNQSYYLAPFFDRDHDGVYNYRKGDYPLYDFTGEFCPGCLGPLDFLVPNPVGRQANQALQGDQTLWWVMNDDGGQTNQMEDSTVGLEIRAQAFAFSTNDELNDMTFYAYEIINRSSSSLSDVWTGFFTDIDLGDAWDDYIGCDVSRGLGYGYNGRDPDGTGGPDDYGAQPPAVGVDFFRGPYMDPDGIDNPRVTDPEGIMICGPAINGQNFGDGCVDNERYGMTRFIYVGCGGSIGPQLCPYKTMHYYNLLRGIWTDGVPMHYWDMGYPFPDLTLGPECKFMYPGNSDPCNYGTNGIDPGAPYPAEYWTESQANNPPYNRRMLQSSGPFSMEPGAVNYLCIGIPWARALNGGPMASVEALRVADDKVQAMFDNCFNVMEGPNAPDLLIQELDQELILMISNRKGTSNNYSVTPEDYAVRDPYIIFHDSIPAEQRGDSLYRFEGYQIFQLLDASVTTEDLHNPDKARLVAQCDLKNGVSRIINYYYDPSFKANTPVEEVDGADAGIVHSFRILEDAFAHGDDKRLVNHRQYYYMAVAYAYNNFATYDPNDPYKDGGQKKPYLMGIRSGTGAIRVMTGIPHIVSPENEGTILHSEYGVIPEIVRLEGQGNGGLIVDLDESAEAAILQNGFLAELPYKYNRGPVNVKVLDPLNVLSGHFILKMIPPAFGNLSGSNWVLTHEESGQTWNSETSIQSGNEQLIPEVGLSIQIRQPGNTGTDTENQRGFLEASISFADSNNRWLGGFADDDADSVLNWIRSGQEYGTYPYYFGDYWTGLNSWLDPNEDFESILGGTWAPMALSSTSIYGPCPYFSSAFITKLESLNRLASVDLVITPDKSKWSRCPVFEMCWDTVSAENLVTRFSLRAGSTDGEQGMGWFPGYAINIETGERLNVAFGEDSKQISENGRDMLWNPTNKVHNPDGSVALGGQHWIYIFEHSHDSVDDIYGEIGSPAYDEGAWIRTTLQQPDHIGNRISFVFRAVMWIGAPSVSIPGNWDPANIPCEVKIRLRVSSPYKRFYSTKENFAASPINNNYPCYGFSTEEIATTTASQTAAEGALQIINIVPNPYVSGMAYETGWDEGKVKITNLPEKCSIRIYTLNGELVKTIEKDNAMTSADWDLKSETGKRITSGVYLIHVKVDGVGERILKWHASIFSFEMDVY